MVVHGNTGFVLALTSCEGTAPRSCQLSQRLVRIGRSITSTPMVRGKAAKSSSPHRLATKRSILSHLSNVTCAAETFFRPLLRPREARRSGR